MTVAGTELMVQMAQNMTDEEVLNDYVEYRLEIKRVGGYLHPISKPYHEPAQVLRKESLRRMDSFGRGFTAGYENGLENGRAESSAPEPELGNSDRDYGDLI